MKKILKSLLTILSMIIFFLSLLFTILVFNISYFFNSENITKGIQKMDVAQALHEIENSNKGGMTITEVLDNAYIVAEYYGVSSRVIDEMVNDKDIKQFFGTTAGNVTDYIVNGKNNKALTSTEFNTILDKNIDTWIKNSKVQVTDSQKRTFLDTVKKESGQIINNLPTSKEIASKLGITKLNVLQKIFNKQTKTLLLFSLITSFILIMLLKIKNHRNIVYIGYATLIVGIITVGIGLLSSDLTAYILTKTDILLDVSLFSNMLMKQFVITGIICLVISFVFYVIHLILKRGKRI